MSYEKEIQDNHLELEFLQDEEKRIQDSITANLYWLTPDSGEIVNLKFDLKKIEKEISEIQDELRVLNYRNINALLNRTVNKTK